MPVVTRLLLALIAWAVLLSVAARAQEPVTVVLRPGLDAARIEAMVAAATATGRPVTIRWEEAAEAAKPATAGPKQTATPAREAAREGPTLAEAFEAGLAARLARIPRLGELGGAFARRWAANANGETADVLARIAALLALAALAGFGLRRPLAALGRHRRPPLAREADLVDRTRRALAGLGADLAALGVFLAAGHLGLARLLPAPDLARALGTALVQAGLVFALYRAAGLFLLAPGRPEERLLPLPRADWHYRMLLLYAGVGQVVTLSVGLFGAAGGEPLDVEAWFLLAASVITVQKVWWFWQGRHDIASALLPAAGAAPPNLVRRVGAQALPWLLIAVALLIWAAGNVAAVAPEQGVHWGRAAGATQIVVAVLPILALGIGALARAFVERHHALDAATPGRLALAATARTLIAGGVWVLGVLAIAQIWDAFLRDPASLAAVRGLVRVSAALVAGWALWAFLRAYFDAHAPRHRGAGPGGDEEAEPLVQSRLATVLPLIRDLARGAIVAITALVVLSALGVDIAPLLAGFGVVGLAISFGSQALVRDVVSGVFFMADDAFRVGEYIDTGRLKGTVEKITLRSVQLRHQNGQIHTVPFGQLQAITNFSRDWATVKFLIRLDREADIERARKTIKRVGAEMLEDPELGPEFLQPLKMQGVHEITDSAIVVRCKFTSTPAKPSWIQREALKRIHRALIEAGVPFASNAVTVRGHGGEAARESAAASLGALPPPMPGAA